MKIYKNIGNYRKMPNDFTNISSLSDKLPNNFNNISSFRLKVSGDGSNAISSDFEINDNSCIIQSEKNR